MTHAFLRTMLVAAAFGGGLAAAQAAPPWGTVAYVAEVAQYLDNEPLDTILVEVAPAGVRYSVRSEDDELLLEVLLTWDGADVTAYSASPPGGPFEPAFPGFDGAVLAAVVDPRTPEIGACAWDGTTCAEEGEETYGDRRALRVSMAVDGLGTSTVWVDLATGFTLGAEGASADVAVRTVLVRFEERAPDPDRLRP